jgi:hypothetical protein
MCVKNGGHGENQRNVSLLCQSKLCLAVTAHTKQMSQSKCHEACDE